MTNPDRNPLRAFGRTLTVVARALLVVLTLTVTFAATAPVALADATPSPAPTDTSSPSPSPTDTSSPSPSPTDTPSPSPAPTGTAGIIVTMVPGLTASDQEAVIAADGGTETSSIPALRMHFVDVPVGDVSTYMQTYQSDPNVQSVDRDRTRDAEASPSDPAYSNQWALPQVGWDNAYGSVSPSGSSTIAVLDTGVDGSNADLSGRLTSAGYSAFGTDPTNAT